MEGREGKKKAKRGRKDKEKRRKSKTPHGDEIVHTMWEQLGLNPKSLKSLKSQRTLNPIQGWGSMASSIQFLEKGNWNRRDISLHPHTELQKLRKNLEVLTYERQQTSLFVKRLEHVKTRIEHIQQGNQNWQLQVSLFKGELPTFSKLLTFYMCKS